MLTAEENLLTSLFKSTQNSTRYYRTIHRITNSLSFRQTKAAIVKLDGGGF